MEETGREDADVHPEARDGTEAGEAACPGVAGLLLRWRERVDWGRRRGSAGDCRRAERTDHVPSSARSAAMTAKEGRDPVSTPPWTGARNRARRPAHSLALTEKSTRNTAKMAMAMLMTLPAGPSGSANQPLMAFAQPSRNMATIVMAQPATMNGRRRPKRDFDRLETRGEGRCVSAAASSRGATVGLDALCETACVFEGRGRRQQRRAAQR